MNSMLKVVFGLFLAIGLVGIEAAPSVAAERVVVVQGRYAHSKVRPAHSLRHVHSVRIYGQRQNLGRPLVEPHGRILHLAYFPRTFHGAAFVRGPYAHRHAYYHSRRYVHVRHHHHARRHARVHRHRHVHHRWASRPACPVVNRFGTVVAFARGC
jgi:hypothetical protein